MVETRCSRARAFEHFQGALGSADAEHKLYLFDIQMFTKITLNGTPSTSDYEPGQLVEE